MPNLAILLIVIGILLIYLEFILVGKLVFGIAGSFLTLFGLHIFLRLPHTTFGLLLIALAFSFYVVEAKWNTFFVAGFIATVLFGCGFWRVCPGNPVSPWLDLLLSAVFGVITITMLSIAKRARRNKRADL